MLVSSMFGSGIGPQPDIDMPSKHSPTAPHAYNVGL
jgi:hypothetical protein